MTQNISSMQVITRFAPSPTGDLHIGGARTALFNYLFAKRHDGKFLLRIEDTDRARSTESAVNAIFEGLNWLGLKSDGEPLFQNSRAARHAEIAHKLIESGGAFKCYATQEEIEIERQKAMAEGRALRSPWRDKQEDVSNLPFSIRMRAPDFNKEIVIDDKVQGPVKTMGQQIDDMVLLRTDGTPTYMLAVVVDDYDMGITHVIRGDDHLTNAARQSVLIDLMGWKRPIYAHIPLIHGDDGKKLSKRHGALAVGEYKDMGYLPEAVLSYLLRLGWSKGDLDIIPIEEAEEIFDLEGLGKSPSRLDFDKLAQVNSHFIKLADDKRLTSLMYDLAHIKQIEIDSTYNCKLLTAMPILKERAKTIQDLIIQCEYLWAKTPLQLNEKSTGILDETASEIIEEVRIFLSEPILWDRFTIKEKIDLIAQNRGVSLGKIGPIIRAALTGGLVAPDLAIIAETLGKEETLLRLNQALVRIENRG